MRVIGSKLTHSKRSLRFDHSILPRISLLLSHSLNNIPNFYLFPSASDMSKHFCFKKLLTINLFSCMKKSPPPPLLCLHPCVSPHLFLYFSSAFSVFLGWTLCFSCLGLLAIQLWLISIVFACWRYFHDKSIFFVSFVPAHSSAAVVVLRPLNNVEVCPSV